MLNLNINAKARNKVLNEPVVVFSDDEVVRKHTKTLETLVEYYEKTLEAIGGEEIWEIFERLAKAEAVLAERRKKKFEKSANKQRKAS